MSEQIIKPSLQYCLYSCEPDLAKLIKEEGEKLARRARTLRSRDVTQYVYARLRMDYE